MNFNLFQSCSKLMLKIKFMGNLSYAWNIDRWENRIKKKMTQLWPANLNFLDYLFIRDRRNKKSFKLFEWINKLMAELYDSQLNDKLITCLTISIKTGSISFCWMIYFYLWNDIYRLYLIEKSWFYTM